MKRLLLLLSVFFFAINGLQAQVPQGIPYQAAARGANGQPLVNTAVKVRFSIIDSVATGTTVYQETHTTSTNTVGLFSVNVGLGTAVAGTFAGINWGMNFKFMKVELDPTGTGANYTDLGTQQMMSVPYALYAGNVIGSSNASNSTPFGLNGNFDINQSLAQSGVNVVSNAGNGIWCCGPSFGVPAGKLWKIVSYGGAINSPAYVTTEMWLNEGQALTFQGNSGNGAVIPFQFVAFEYTKANLDFNVVSNAGNGIWCCGPSFVVPAGKLWKVVSYSGAINSPAYTSSEMWLNEGQALTFQGNSGNGASIPFQFVAFEFNK